MESELDGEWVKEVIVTWGSGQMGLGMVIDKMRVR